LSFGSIPEGWGFLKECLFLPYLRGHSLFEGAYQKLCPEYIIFMPFDNRGIFMPFDRGIFMPFDSRGIFMPFDRGIFMPFDRGILPILWEHSILFYSWSINDFMPLDDGGILI
jgi:hypothetical protein